MESCSPCGAPATSHKHQVARVKEILLAPPLASGGTLVGHAAALATGSVSGGDGLGFKRLQPRACSRGPRPGLALISSLTRTPPGPISRPLPAARAASQGHATAATSGAGRQRETITCLEHHRCACTVPPLHADKHTLISLQGFRAEEVTRVAPLFKLRCGTAEGPSG